jgi:hypothetical protein
VKGAMAAKIVIVLGAFPVLVHAVFTAGRLLLNAILPSVLELAGSWSEVAGKAAVVAMFLLAVRFAFGVCRRLWPTPAVR